MRTIADRAFDVIERGDAGIAKAAYGPGHHLTKHGLHAPRTAEIKGTKRSHGALHYWTHHGANLAGIDHAAILQRTQPADRAGRQVFGGVSHDAGIHTRGSKSAHAAAGHPFYGSRQFCFVKAGADQSGRGLLDHLADTRCDRGGGYPAIIKRSDRLAGDGAGDGEFLFGWQILNLVVQ